MEENHLRERLSDEEDESRFKTKDCNVLLYRNGMEKKTGSFLVTPVDWNKGLWENTRSL